MNFQSIWYAKKTISCKVNEISRAERLTSLLWKTKKSSFWAIAFENSEKSVHVRKIINVSSELIWKTRVSAIDWYSTNWTNKLGETILVFFSDTFWIKPNRGAVEEKLDRAWKSLYMPRISLGENYIYFYRSSVPYVVQIENEIIHGPLRENCQGATNIFIF